MSERKYTDGDVGCFIGAAFFALLGFVFIAKGEGLGGVIFWILAGVCWAAAGKEN